MELFDSWQRFILLANFIFGPVFPIQIFDFKYGPLFLAGSAKPNLATYTVELFEMSGVITAPTHWPSFNLYSYTLIADNPFYQPTL